jgi:hypothetical protein
MIKVGITRLSIFRECDPNFKSDMYETVVVAVVAVCRKKMWSFLNN